MVRIVIVCTANICRSPVGEALLRERLNEAGLTDWGVTSAGTWATSGQRASAYGIEIMAERGYDMSQHRSQPVGEQLLEESDLLLCMESGHVEALRSEFPNQAHKIFMLAEMAGRRYSVSDPYGGPKPAYERMIQELEGLIERGLPRIIELARTNAGLPLGGE